MKAVWMDLSIGEIVEGEGLPTPHGEETLEIIEIPKFTERSEIVGGDILYISEEMILGLHNMLNMSIHRVNQAILKASQEATGEGDLLP